MMLVFIPAKVDIIRWSGDFANRSTARGARTIMARKLGIGILLAVTLWLYFRSRSTARGAHHHGEEIRHWRSTIGDALVLFPQQYRRMVLISAKSS